MHRYVTLLLGDGTPPPLTYSSTTEKLRQEKDNVVQLRSISSSQRLIRLCMITGLLCQHCNFDVTDQVIDRSDRLRQLCQVCFRD